MTKTGHTILEMMISLVLLTMIVTGTSTLIQSSHQVIELNLEQRKVQRTLNNIAVLLLAESRSELIHGKKGLFPGIQGGPLKINKLFPKWFQTTVDYPDQMKFKLQFLDQEEKKLKRNRDTRIKTRPLPFRLTCHWTSWNGIEFNESITCTHTNW